MRAHWRYLANMIEFVLPLAHPSPQPKRQIDRSASFAQLMAKCHQACLGMSFPLIIAPSHGWSAIHLIHASLSPPESINQMASRLVQPCT